MSRFGAYLTPKPSLSTRKAALVALAETERGKPFYSRPVDARVRAGLLEIKHQASHEFEPHWETVGPLPLDLGGAS